MYIDNTYTSYKSRGMVELLSILLLAYSFCAVILSFLGHFDRHAHVLPSRSRFPSSTIFKLSRNSGALLSSFLPISLALSRQSGVNQNVRRPRAARKLNFKRTRSSIVYRNSSGREAMFPLDGFRFTLVQLSNGLFTTEKPPVACRGEFHSELLTLFVSHCIHTATGTRLCR